MNTETFNDRLITHQNIAVTKLQLSEYEQKLHNSKSLALPLELELDLLMQLSEFELGRFLLVNKGLNGYWTSYTILHGPTKNNLHPLEHWLLHTAPAIKATRERFGIFKQLLQQNLRDNITIASIPCGMLDDLLGLDLGRLKDITFVGIDLDPKSIAHAKQNIPKNTTATVKLYQKDAWLLDEHEQFEIITSNGLNIYEANDNKVIELYKNFHNALKVGGILITSFLTPPPIMSQSPWKDYVAADLNKQKAIFSDIIGANWQAYRTEEQMREQLAIAGFNHIEMIYDHQAMFPVVLAKKAL